MNNDPSEDLLFLLKILNYAPIQDGEFVDGFFRAQLLYLNDKGRPFHEWDDELDENLLFTVEKEVMLDIKKYLAKYPELLSYINHQTSLQDEYRNIQESDEIGHVNSFLLAWSEYVAMRNKLLGIIHISYKMIQNNEKIGTWKPSRSQIIGLDYFFVIRDDYSLKIEGDLVDQTLKEVDIRRIRHCGYCRHLFWAYRLDNLTCSKKCGQNFRTQKFRKKQKDRFQSRIK